MSEQQFKQIHDFNEILTRPNFIESAVISKEEDGIKLKELVAHYQLKERVKCGIAQCGTKHLMGYVVTLSNGKEIIIGNKCGKNNFGVDFTNKEREFKSQRERAEQHQFIKDTFTKLPELKQTFENVLLQSGPLTFIDIQKAVKGLNGEVFDYWMLQTIRSRVSSNGVITEERFKTEEEREIEEIFNEGMNKSYVSDTKIVTVAVIEHFDIVANWHKAEKLKAYFEKMHREIRDPAGMPNDVFKNLVKDLRVYDHNLRELREFCTYGNRLLTKENLSKLSVLFNKSNELKKLNAFIDNIDQRIKGVL